MTAANRGRHDLTVLAAMPFEAMSKGQRISATKAGLIPPIRSQRERQLRARYGLTLEAFDALLAEQDGRCAVCRQPLTVMYVDHNHATGRRRQILCPNCNTLVGLLETDPARVTAALSYVACDGGIIAPREKCGSRDCPCAK